MSGLGERDRKSRMVPLCRAFTISLLGFLFRIAEGRAFSWRSIVAICVMSSSCEQRRMQTVAANGPTIVGLLSVNWFDLCGFLTLRKAFISIPPTGLVDSSH